MTTPDESSGGHDGPCGGCVGDYVYRHADNCDRLCPVDECKCRAIEEFRHDLFCDTNGVFQRWPDRDDHHYSRHRWGY